MAAEGAARRGAGLCVVAEPYLSGSHAQLCDTLASASPGAHAAVANDGLQQQQQQQQEEQQHEGQQQEGQQRERQEATGGDVAAPEGDLRRSEDASSSEWPEVQIVGWKGAAKWHWRMLVSAAHFAEAIPRDRVPGSIVFSAMMNVAELLGLRPDLHKCKKVVYFHENQLEYPRQSEAAAQSQGQSAFNLGWNQIASCLCADVIAFNSQYNMDSFYKLAPPFINKAPTGSRPPALDIDALRAKSQVLGVPITAKLESPVRSMPNAVGERQEPLRVVWPHRFEHDKGSDEWIMVLEDFSQLNEARPIHVYILGDITSSAQESADQARAKLESLPNVSLMRCGRIKERSEYLDLLRTMDVAVSTARHEFYGVAMLEAATCGCYPLCPDRLSYPELFPDSCLYRTTRQLAKRLRDYSNRPDLPATFMSGPEWHERLAAFQWDNGKGALAERWRALLHTPTNVGSADVPAFADYLHHDRDQISMQRRPQDIEADEHALQDHHQHHAGRSHERFPQHQQDQDQDLGSQLVGAGERRREAGNRYSMRSTGATKKTYKLAQVANSDPAIKEQRLDQSLQHDMVQMPLQPGRQKRPKRHCILCCRRCLKGETHRYREGRQTTWKCSVCNVNLCKSCFADFHRLPELVRPHCQGGPRVVAVMQDVPAELADPQGPSVHGSDAEVPDVPTSSSVSLGLGVPTSSMTSDVPLDDLEGENQAPLDEGPARKKRTRNRFRLVHP